MQAGAKIWHDTQIDNKQNRSLSKYLEDFGSFLLIFPYDHSYRLNHTTCVPLTYTQYYYYYD